MTKKRRSKHGLSFSWKRALGISAAKGKISRKIGIPLTKQGRQRKVGAALLKLGVVNLEEKAQKVSPQWEELEELRKTFARGMPVLEDGLSEAVNSQNLEEVKTITEAIRRLNDTLKGIDSIKESGDLITATELITVTAGTMEELKKELDSGNTY